MRKGWKKYTPDKQKVKIYFIINLRSAGRGIKNKSRQKGGINIKTL